MTTENFKHAETLLNKLRIEHDDQPVNENVDKIIDEILEFLEAAEDEYIQLKDENKSLQDEVNDLNTVDEEEGDEGIISNEDNVGLDVIKWGLDKDNMVIRERMEAFVESLKKEFGMLP